MIKNVIINGKFLAQRLTGVQRVAVELVRHLDNINDKNSGLELISPKDASNLDLKNISKKKVGLFKGNLWEQISLPVYAGKKSILNLGNVAPLISQNNYTFVHDISFHVNKSFFSRSFVAWYEFMIPMILERSKQIFVNSEFTKKEIVKYYGDYSDKTSVLYLGHEHISSEVTKSSNILKKLGLKNDEFLLVVSSRSPNKNFRRLCKAVKKIKASGYNIPLVIAGGNNSIFKEEGLENSENIYVTGYVSDNELIALYRGAKLFVFPSIYEGFGLPPLEALKLGTPSVVSKTSALPEVYQDAVLYCDPMDVEDIKEKILMLWEDEKLRSDYLKKGEKILKKCSWEDAAKKMLNHVRES